MFFTKGKPNNFKGQQNRQKKIISFDEEKRREFLTGFHKRKLERKIKAKQQFEEKLKHEKKRLKQEARDRYYKLLNKRPQLEVEEYLKKSEFETADHKISILELDVSCLNDNYIGQNTMIYDQESDIENEDVTNSDNDFEISGFEIEEKEKRLKKAQVPTTNVSGCIIGSKKELKKSLKLAALKEFQESKIFKRKKQLERQKNKRLSKVEKIRKKKLEMKKNKGKKGRAKKSKSTNQKKK